MKKIVFILFSVFLTLSVYAKDIELNLIQNSISNANTALLYLKSKKSLQDPKLTVDKRNINFSKHPKEKGTFFAFVPFDYHEKLGEHNIIISYILNKKRTFKAVKVKLHEGDYQSETLQVASSKVSLSPKNKERTKKEYQEAMAVYNHVSKNTLQSTSFIMPLESPITSDFGTKRVYNGSLQGYHSGTDFKADVGTPIVASSDGTVKIAKNRFYAGNSVVIDHGYGVYTGYYHLSQIQVKVNQKVKQGEVVGLSGKTGRVTGPHLHFSMRVHGVQVDPLQFIKVTHHLQ